MDPHSSNLCCLRLNHKTKIKNSLDGFSSIFEQAEERISDLKIYQLIITNLSRKKKRMKKNENFRKLWEDTNICTKLSIMGVPKGEERQS